MQRVTTSALPALLRQAAWASTDAVAINSRLLSSAAAETSSSSGSTDTPAQLTPQQAQVLSKALQQLQGPVQTASRIAALTAMSALYRDIHLVAASIHQRQVLGMQDPLVDPAPSPSQAAAASKPAPRSSTFPLRDVTKLPDTEAPPMRLDQRHMDKVTCWAALQPSHIETSSMLLTGINLFPPQEATYPTYVDWDAVVKGLEERKSRKRIKLWRRLQKRQDKYQLNIWDHHSGEL